ncbi:MAG TPA: ATP-binding protein [Candidatus Limnocylindrales bacterium]|jgi:hypothetical protein
MTVAEPESVSREQVSAAHLRLRMGSIERRVAAAVERRRHRDTEPDDPFRGLHISPTKADEILEARPIPEINADADEDVAAIEQWADTIPDSASALRLRSLEGAFDLDRAETELLLIALAPDVDARFEKLYGYLNDDVTRRRATVGLAFELLGMSTFDPGSRHRLSTAGALVGRGLLLVEDVDRPFLGRTLRVPDRVTSFLLGDEEHERELGRLVDDMAPDLHSASAALARAVASGTRLCYVHEVAGSSGRTTALASIAFTSVGRFAVDLTRLSALGAAETVALMRQAVVEARLRWSVLVAGPVDALVDRSLDAIAVLADSGWPAVLYGSVTWEPRWARAVPFQTDAPVPDGEQRGRLWSSALRRRDAATANGHLAALLEGTNAFHLTQPQIDRAVESAFLVATAENADLASRHLQAGARLQNAAGLEQRATRIEPRADWGDLVVPMDVSRQLSELAGRARHRDQVLGGWRMGGRSVRGRGITALFAGESGTGKTLSAEVIAHELGLDLYVIDLSTVVDKYIGETEKNLDRIFTEADRVNGVLLFDEADAIFGKRSEVRDARDRYANVEVAYLLQRMERFDGLAVLTTNLRANLDESFTRRLDVLVDFPAPDRDARLALWRMHLPAHLPQADELDLEFLADRFSLSGGNIRNICLTAAFLAADDGEPVTMKHLIQGTGREYRKLGRLTLESEFGRYHALVPERPVS